MVYLENNGLDNLKANVRLYFKEKPIKKAYLFGSLARNDANESSDIDILVELDKSKIIGMIEYIKLIAGLEYILKRKVDMITTDSVSPYIQPFIDKDKILIYEA